MTEAKIGQREIRIPGLSQADRGWIIRERLERRTERLAREKKRIKEQHQRERGRKNAQTPSDGNIKKNIEITRANSNTRWSMRKAQWEHQKELLDKQWSKEG